MHRGRPHRGGYPRPYGGGYSRGPPHHHDGHSPRPSPGPGRPPPPPGHYREDRERHGYHHGYPEDYRPRSPPPRRRYSSPGSPGYRGNGPPPRPREHPSKRLSPSPSRGDLPIDHSLVITVGNELTGGPRSSRNSEHHYERDYHMGDPHYKHSSGMRPGYEHGSEERRGRSRARSHSRGRSRSRSRGKSRGRSKSRARSRSQSRGRSRGRSKSRPRSRSRSRSRSRGRSRGRSRAREKSRSRSHSSRSHSSRSSPRPPMPNKGSRQEDFRELEMARRRKELEEMLGVPMKSILKKRVDSEMDSPAAVQSSDSPVDVSGEHQSSSLSRETERFLSVVTKGMESGLFANMLGEMAGQPHEQRVRAMANALNSGQYDEILSMVKQETTGQEGVGASGDVLLPHERVRQDGSSDFSRILGAMGHAPEPPEKRKTFADIEDEEKFLYGDEDEGDKEKAPSQHHPATPASATPLLGQSEMGHYGDGRPEIAKYHDASNKIAMSQYRDSTPEVPGYPGGREFVQRQLSQAYAGAADPLYHQGGGAAGEDRLDSGLLRGSHQQVAANVRYHHREQAVAQNNGGQAGAPQSQAQPVGYPPGLDPRESKEREEVAEYEKIQDLLKAIGLDLGVAEISKMAARTQERLHGKKPAPGSSSTSSSHRVERLQGRRASSGSYSRRKSHSSTSSSNSGSPSPSPSQGQGRGRSRGACRKRSPELERRSASPRPPTRQVSLAKPGSRAELDTDDKSWGLSAMGKGGAQPRITVSMNPPPNLAAVPQPVAAAHAMSGYQSQVPAYPMPPPNYPPPGYGGYEGYMPYMPPGWPMYPPPTMLPPQSPVEDVSARPYLRVIETVGTEAKDSRSPQAAGRGLKQEHNAVYTGQPAEMSQSQRLLEEENQASQKEKVIEERDKLKKEREVRLKKKEYLMKELERLRKQQGELLRKKRREKDGHKDPLLAELGRLQEEVIAQISRLRKEHATAEQKRTELDKVALCLGLRGSDKHRREGQGQGRPSGGEHEPPLERAHTAKAPAATATPAAPSSSIPSAKAASSASVPSPEKQKPMKSQQGAPSPEKSAVLYEYYDSGNHWCKNCNTVCGSMFDFFTHLHSKSHRKTLDPYDRPWASSSSEKEKKRTPGEKVVRPAKGCEFLVPVMGFYCQLCEEFFGDQICAEEHVTCHKHNAKYKKRMDEHPLYEQRRNLDRQAGLSVGTDGWDRKQSSDLKRKLEPEESEETPDHRASSPVDEPPPSHYRDRKSYSSRDERYSRSYREKTSSSHRDERGSGRRDERASGHREDYPSGHREERREGAKEEKEGRRRTPVREVKSESQRPAEAVEKPASIPQVGPSLSILAKVRKREEAVKSAAAASTSAFGKFSWKKPEKEKEKEKEKGEKEKEEKEKEKEAEKEKVTENLTEEESGGDDGGDKEEGKGTVAKSKTIAIKLSGKTIIPPSNAWVPFSSAQPAASTKNRPNLPTPTMVLRKSSRIAAAKPAPLNTFLSIKPPGSNNSKPLPVVKPPAKKEAVVTPDLISKAFGGEEVVLKTPEVPVETPPASDKDRQRDPSPDVTMTSATETTAAAPPLEPPETLEPQKKLEPPETLEPPPPGSDEAVPGVPGVPESEQAMAVLVCPPPLRRNLRSNDKPKSSMAAAKAQDLYDIFYSGGARGGASDVLAGTKQPKGAEATKSEDSGPGAPKTESEDQADSPSTQTSDCGVGVAMELEEEPVKGQSLVEQTLEEQPIEGQALEGQSLKEQSLVEHTLEGQALEELPLKEQTLEELPLKEQPLIEQALEELPVKEQPLKKQTLEELPLKERTLEELPVKEQILEEVPLKEQTLEEVPLKEQSLEGKSLEGQSLEEQMLEEQPLERQTLEEQPLEGQSLEGKQLIEQAQKELPLKEQTLEELPLVGQALVEQTLEEQTLEELPLVGQALVEQPLEEQTLEGQTLVEQPLEGQTLEGQTLEIPDPDKDLQIVDMVDLDMFTFNFE